MSVGADVTSGGRLYFNQLLATSCCIYDQFSTHVSVLTQTTRILYSVHRLFISCYFEVCYRRVYLLKEIRCTVWHCVSGILLRASGKKRGRIINHISGSSRDFLETWEFGRVQVCLLVVGRREHELTNTHRRSLGKGREMERKRRGSYRTCKRVDVTARWSAFSVAMDTQPPAQVQTRDRRTVRYVAPDLIMRRLGIQHDVARSWLKCVKPSVNAQCT